MSSKRSKAWKCRKDALDERLAADCPFRVGDWVTDDIDRDTCVVTAVSVAHGRVTVSYQNVQTQERRDASPGSLMHADAPSDAKGA